MKRAMPSLHAAARRRFVRAALALPGAALADGGAQEPRGAGGTPAASAAAAAAPTHRLALALGSGSLHGHAHLGVMRVFEARKLRPDLIVGTSVGAIVGALWAAGIDAATIERTAGRFGLFDAARLAWPGLGLMRNDGLRRAIAELIGERPIESWPIPFAAVATDFATGERVIVDRGDGARAVAASACMPVLFHPVQIDGRALVDGALVEPVPVRAARACGGRSVVAVDVAFRPADEPVRHALGAAFQTLHVLINALIAEQIGSADLRVQLELHALMRGRRGDWAGTLAAAGEQAAERMWPHIVEIAAR